MPLEKDDEAPMRLGAMGVRLWGGAEAAWAGDRCHSVVACP